MKPEEAGQVLGLLNAGFHRETMEQGTIDLWLDILDSMDAEYATVAALDWVKSEDRFPTISQFRHAYHVVKQQHQVKLPPEERVPADEFGFPLDAPAWIKRYTRARSAACDKEGRPRRDEKGNLTGDWRVFPEQIAAGAYTQAEAEAIGIMPEDAWVT